MVSAKRVVKYSVRAAREALDGFANEDAIALYQRAILSHKLAAGEREVDLRRSSLHAWRSRAHYELDLQVSRARIDLEYAFRFAGFPAVGTGAKAVANPRRPLRSIYLLEDRGAVDRRAQGGRKGPLSPTRCAGHSRRMDGARLLGSATSRGGCQSIPRLRACSRRPFVAPRRRGDRTSRIRRPGSRPCASSPKQSVRRAVELAERSGELQARVSARVLLGMHCTLVGRPDAAIEHLETAKDPANKLGGGLWRHRARFMLGEAMLCQGRFKEARDAFAEAAQLSIGTPSAL